MILMVQTIPILLYRFPWWKFENLPLLKNWYHQDILFFHEMFLRTLLIARFRREELLRDQVELVVPFSKGFYQVALIDRTSQPTLFTLEKTQHGRKPILNNLLKRNSPWIAHGGNDQKFRIIFNKLPWSIFSSNWFSRILTSVLFPTSWIICFDSGLNGLKWLILS